MSVCLASPDLCPFIVHPVCPAVRPLTAMIFVSFPPSAVDLSYNGLETLANGTFGSVGAQTTVDYNSALGFHVHLHHNAVSILPATLFDGILLDGISNFSVDLRANRLTQLDTALFTPMGLRQSCSVCVVILQLPPPCSCACLLTSVGVNGSRWGEVWLDQEPWACV